MNNKKLKVVAERIAELEYKYSISASQEEKDKIERNIASIVGNYSMADMLELDDYIQSNYIDKIKNI
jgi:hypothetical protein